MWQPIVGTESIRDGVLTRGSLRWNYNVVHPRVYLPKGADPTVQTNAVAAWLWTQRRGVVAGRAAAALHGAKWVDVTAPVEIITEHTRRRAGGIVREGRIGADEVTGVG